MYKRIVACFLAGLFLTASVILPMGDFSLMRDIPGMYRNYTKITSPEEMGVIDFIGDYLLYGKQIFGHNERDKVPTKGNDVQFQHQASPLNVIFARLPVTSFNGSFSVSIHTSFYRPFYTSGYREKLFRPPLA